MIEFDHGRGGIPGQLNPKEKGNTMNKILAIIVVIVAIAAQVIAASSVFAEDTKAKIGAYEFTETFMNVNLDDPLIGIESYITCTKVSSKLTRCVTSDELGWAETMVCKSGKCTITAHR